MAKKLRTREILNYLLARDKFGKPLWSKREISKNLSVSQATVGRIDKALKEYIGDASKLLAKSDEDLNRTLELSSSDEFSPTASDFRQIIVRLKDYYDNEEKRITGKTILEEIQSKESNHFNLSEEGKQFFSSCKYGKFIYRLNSYCLANGLTNRLFIKPGEYMEIGIFDINDLSDLSEETEKNSTKASDISNRGKKPKRNAFYIYLPYSRMVSITVVDFSRMEMLQLLAISRLMMFMTRFKSFPEKVIGREKIGAILGENIPIAELHRFLRNLKLMYSIDANHCYFMKTETKLRVSLKAASSQHNTYNNALLQEEIEDLCRIQNEHYYQNGMHSRFGKSIL